MLEQFREHLYQCNALEFIYAYRYIYIKPVQHALHACSSQLTSDNLQSGRQFWLELVLLSLHSDLATMPRRPFCPEAVAFAYIMIACSNGDIQMFFYSGDFTMEQLASCFASLISGRPTIMEGAWGTNGYWMGSASCLYNCRLISFMLG